MNFFFRTHKIIIKCIKHAHHWNTKKKNCVQISPKAFSVLRLISSIQNRMSTKWFLMSTKTVHFSGFDLIFFSFFFSFLHFFLFVNSIYGKTKIKTIKLTKNTYLPVDSAWQILNNYPKFGAECRSIVSWWRSVIFGSGGVYGLYSYII